MHRSDVYLRVVEAYGLTCPDRRCELKLNAQDMQSIRTKLNAQGITETDQVIVLNTGGNWDLKRWPLAHWGELAQYIHQRPEFKVVFSGAAKDADHVNSILAQVNVPAVNLAGQTSLGESLALFRRAAAVVSADTGPLHLANSIGVSVVGIFGPTRSEITGPCGMGESVVLFKNVGCNNAPCYHLGCLDNVCMKSIGAKDVWDAVQKFLR
jgi:heptosyltransferase-1